MLEGVPVGGGSVCLIQNSEFKIASKREQNQTCLD